MADVRRSIETLAHVVFIVSCVGMTAIVVQKHVSPSEAMRAQEGVPFRPGQTVQSIPEASFDSADQSIVLFVKSTCQPCSDSMPFFKRISQARRIAPRMQIIAASSDLPEITDAYLQANEIRVDRIVQINPEEYLLQATPSIVIVDGRGVAVTSWSGALSRSQESSLLRKLSGS